MSIGWLAGWRGSSRLTRYKPINNRMTQQEMLEAKRNKEYRRAVYEAASRKSTTAQRADQR